MQPLGREVMVTRFEASDRRFESIDLRIGDLIKTMDERFTSLAARFAGINRHIGVVKWFVISSFVVLGSIISLVAILQ